MQAASEKQAVGVTRVTKGRSEVCSHRVGFSNCQRRGEYRVTGDRGAYCLQHATIRAGRKR